MQVSAVVANGSAAVQFVGQLISAMQLELAVLLLAACAHVILFGKHRIGGTAKDPLKAPAKPQASKARGRGGCGAPQGGSDGDGAGTARAALKAALQASDLEGAMESLKGFASGAPLVASQGALLQQLLRLASRRASVPALLQSFRESGLTRTVCLCNALLDACVECEDLGAAERVWTDAVEEGTADVVTYNTIIKARLSVGNLKGAREAVKAMGQAGLQPNCVTFNELLDATISADHDAAWAIVREMKACGLQPNRITCSILLKSVQQGTRAVDADRALAVVDSVGEDMDEVLLSSTLEACIRVNRADLLARQLARHCDNRRIQVKGAQTYGSIIRAYGCVADVKGIKKTWLEMRSRQIPLTSITLGCTVEALSANGDPDGAHSLVREVMADGPRRSVVNAVIYCSVVKGFSHQKRFDRVWALYQEMLAEDLQAQFTSVTYNTLIDACSRCGMSGRTPFLLQEMLKQGIEPNLVTYSAVLKGYCQDNRLDKARELLETMKESQHVRPDEQTYNTLLDGCARQNLYKQGMEVFEEMKANGVKPSNFTLSILVKLANRGRQLDVAFQLCEDLPLTYHFSLNVHVYNNLLQACVVHKDLPKAFSVLVRMLRAGVRPDPRSYALLLRGQVHAGEGRAAAAVLRAALGLEHAHPELAEFRASLREPREALPLELISEVVEGISRQCRLKELALELAVQLRQRRGIRLDAKLAAGLARKVTDERKDAA